ncbi:MAG: polyphosphate kinase 1 [Acidobacteria bacterium]|nr:polyphosphate kinase 1 [Acidobacteriota bacterium]
MRPGALPGPLDVLPPDPGAVTGSSPLFLDPDLGAIAFQRRVLEEAQDERTPLLERVKFLAILGANLTTLARRTRLAAAAGQLWSEAAACFARRLRPMLADHGIEAPALGAAPTGHDLLQLWSISRIERPELRDVPLGQRDEVGSDLFEAIGARDILLHHPCESFRPVIDLIRQAAADPAVTAIAMTLYRTDRESPIGQALVDALRRGKRVETVVELRARHDEENNARWASALRQAGAHVTYGLVGFKVHAKLAVITRREGAATRRYVHLSSGNYHAETSQTYTDVALLTRDETIASDAAGLFDFLAGRTDAPTFRRLLVAPFGLRREVRDLVAREIECSRRGVAGHIILKMNALTDRDVIRQLYRASQAGVRVDLIVRGVCCLRPGVPGLSDGIHVRSIVGRFLEHSRIWWFRNGGREEIFIGSADLRPRNLGRRVEVMAPVGDSALARRIRHEILSASLADTVSARVLRGDGRYVRLAPSPGEPSVCSQRALLEPRTAGAAS